MMPARSSCRGSTSVERLCATLYVAVFVGLVATAATLDLDPNCKRAVRLSGPVRAGFDHPRRWMPDGLKVRWKHVDRKVTLSRKVNKDVLTRIDRKQALAPFEKTVHTKFGKASATYRLTPELEARYYEAWREGKAEPVRGYLFIRNRIEWDREVLSKQITIDYVDLFYDAVFVEADGSRVGTAPWHFTDPFGGRRRGFAAPSGEAPADKARGAGH